MGTDPWVLTYFNSSLAIAVIPDKALPLIGGGSLDRWVKPTGETTLCETPPPRP